MGEHPTAAADAPKPKTAAILSETDSLTPKQGRAIEALFVEPTIGRAAEAVGVHERTLRRWMREPAFADAFRSARAECLTRAVGRLHGLLDEAVHTLRRLQKCDSPSVELGAAKAILEQALRGAEVLDLAERVKALEDAARSSEAPQAPPVLAKIGLAA